MGEKVIEMREFTAVDEMSTTTLCGAHARRLRKRDLSLQ
jgi:hypothetical protein